MLDDFAPTCPVCGVPVRDTELHQRFHDGLGEMARKVFAPDSTPEEWQQAIREVAERHGQPGDPFADKAAQRGG
jgi:hypothetical protein